VTYNFDPERWYELRLARLEQRRTTGEISAEVYRRELDDLERRYDEMLRRLDGTFEIPPDPDNA
jgi:Tfp pilus assembly protein PilO